MYGAKLKVEEGDRLSSVGLVEWDPYTFAILTEIGGTIQFKDLLEGVTMHEEVDEVTGLSRWSLRILRTKSVSRHRDQGRQAQASAT